MKKVIGLLSFLLVIGSLNAQTSGQVAQYTPGVGGETDGLYLNAMGSIADKLDKLDYTDDTIEGSPYQSNTFAPGQLFYGDENVGEIFYRYNAYNEEIEIKQKNTEIEPIRGLGKDKKIRLVANGKSMSFKTFVDKRGNTKNGYMTLVSDGEYKLYKHLKVTFKEAKKAENSLVKGSPARFSQSTVYYLESPDGKRLDEVQLNNKKLLELVDKSKQEDLKQYLKENKIKVNDVNDLNKVVNFLNG
ncbi:hypothetical protein [Croceivirga thetidis]|uniref:Uncharacterized protein n=1 Tax=Croceivirga thetidis TaxID=2721623 RepID=A0ABX1GUD4_9FLAO|nr:hypothetical protein [Croceivirga thetidis]NKI33239.1 hypothetical protein [Croceivirga thetidis]